MTEAGYYVHWGVVQISLTNLLVIVMMLLVFAAAVTFRMPAGHRRNRNVPPEAPRDDQ